MTKLFADDNGHPVQIVTPDFSNIQNVPVAIASAATAAAVPAGCKLVVLISTTACWFNRGVSPTAAKDATSIYLPAGVYFYLPVSGVDASAAKRDKIAFIRDAADGTAQVIPCM